MRSLAARFMQGEATLVLYDRAVMRGRLLSAHGRELPQFRISSYCARSGVLHGWRAHRAHKQAVSAQATTKIIRKGKQCA